MDKAILTRTTAFFLIQSMHVPCANLAYETCIRIWRWKGRLVYPARFPVVCTSLSTPCTHCELGRSAGIGIKALADCGEVAFQLVVFFYHFANFRAGVHGGCVISAANVFANSWKGASRFLAQ